MKKLRILVVEDSLTIRRRFCEILAADPEMEVVGEAEDGKRAIEMCELLRPDVITLDMVMPVMSGVTATEYIMAYMPTPILIVSASTNRGELFKTYDALAAGAVDVLEKPTVDDVDAAWSGASCRRQVDRQDQGHHPSARALSGTERSARAVQADPAPVSASKFPDQPRGRQYSVVAVGASTAVRLPSSRSCGHCLKGCLFPCFSCCTSMNRSVRRLRNGWTTRRRIRWPTPEIATSSSRCGAR